MKRLLFLFLLCMSLSGASAQDGVITKTFRTAVYDTITRRVVRDSVFHVMHYVSGGSHTHTLIEMPCWDRKVKEVWMELDVRRHCDYYQDFVDYLTLAGKKYVQWSKTASENKVDSFSKRVKPVHRCFQKLVIIERDGKCFHADVEASVSYSIDPSSECLVFGWNRVVASRHTKIEGYVPSFWSAVLTEASGAGKESKYFYNLIVQLDGPDNIQSLLDALDLSVELKAMREEHRKKKEAHDEVDRLFE